MKFLSKKSFFIFYIIIVAFLLFSCASAPTAERVYTEKDESDATTVDGNAVVSLEELFIFDGHIRGAQGLSFNPIREHLASGGWDNHVFVWDYATGEQFLKISDAHASDVVSLAYDSQGEFFISAGLDRTIKVWDSATGKRIKTFDGFKHNVIGVDVYRNSDAIWIAAAVLTGEIALIDYNTGQRYATFWHDSYATNVSFSPDGTMLASTGNDRVIYLWDIASKQEIRRFEGHTAKVNTVDFSSDGTKIASGGWDNMVYVWDVATGEKIYEFENYHDSAVEQVQFSPTGGLLASGARDGVINIFDATTGENLVQYDTGNIRVYNVIFNKDTTKIAVTGYDHLVRVYDITR